MLCLILMLAVSFVQGLLLAVVANTTQRYCIINPLEYIVCGTTTLYNLDCPLLTMTKDLHFVSPLSLMCSVSIVHECSTSCVSEASIQLKLLKEKQLNLNLLYFSIWLEQRNDHWSQYWSQWSGTNIVDQDDQTRCSILWCQYDMW